MKINSIGILLLFTLFSVIFTAPTRTEGLNVVGKSSQDGKTNDAVTYGLGSDGGYTIQNPKKYKSPQIVDKLPESTLHKEVVKGYADERPSVTNYYDGENRLNKVTVECNIIVDKLSCLHQKFCGWCSENGVCIKGNEMGPLDTCPQAYYQFTTRVTEQPPLEIRQVGGPIATTIVKQI